MTSLPLSAVIITRNAAATLERTLSALGSFDDVVVYDNGSSDETVTIAGSFANVRLFEGEFLGFGPTKRHAVSLARHEWILSLDADEVPTPALLDTLRTWNYATDHDAAGSILRHNLMLGKEVRHSGWGNDWLIRLFNKRFSNFNDAMVHESVQPGKHTRVERLVGGITHYAVTDLSQFLEKVNRYSTIRAQNSRRFLSPWLILLKTGFAFFRTYFLRLGLLDGWRGVVIAFSNASGVFWKHMKAYALRHQHPDGH